MTDSHIWLIDRGVLHVGGEDAVPFLQGLVTNDVAGLTIGQARYAALLTPQGKILFDFIVLRSTDGFWLDCALEQAEGLAKRLGFYRLRAKVLIKDYSATHGIISDLSDSSAQLSYRDPRHAHLGWRVIAPFANRPADTDIAAYEARRIALGVPKGGADFVWGDTFPHEANLDRLHGLDFAKGCYVGQEVVSRVEHRGLARKRIVRLIYADATPAVGADVTAGGVSLGTMGTSAAGRGLALLRLDRLAEAKGAPMLAGDVGVEVAE